MILFQRPVVIEDTNLVSSALHWSLEYLQENLGNGTFSVYESDTHIFKYFDEKKAVVHKEFRPPTRRREMKFPEFVDKMKNPKPHDKR